MSAHIFVDESKHRLFHDSSMARESLNGRARW
jgi:hypothetical protein